MSRDVSHHHAPKTICLAVLLGFGPTCYHLDSVIVYANASLVVATYNLQLSLHDLLMLFAVLLCSFVVASLPLKPKPLDPK